MWEFTSPRTIVFGDEALEYLKEIQGNRAFVVSGKSVRRMGIADKVSAYLKEAGMEVKIFDDVEPEPSVETVKKGAAAMSEFGPDWIVGLGGGSSMDAAKAMWILYERPDLEVGMINPIERLGLRQKARLICIPTTSGSGSEATWAAIITNPDEKVKMELPSKEAVPDIAILDPILPSMMPPSLTAQSGLDALTHSVEAYSSPWRNDFSDALAIRAIQIVFEYLPRSFSDAADSEAREKMHLAATMGGLAFGNSQAGAAHSMGHSLGALFKIPHGRCVGIMLPYVMEFSQSIVLDRYVGIARALGIVSGDEEAARELIRRVRSLRKDLSEPDSIRDVGIDEDDFNSRLGDLVDRAMRSALTPICPRIPSAEEYKRLFVCAYNGDRVDF
jgi:alcohol dehydrogenase class IV